VYHERGNESRLQIDLPLGSYVPEFKHLEVPQQPLPKEVQPAPSTEIRAAATASLEKISGESRGAVLSHARVGSFRVLASAPAFWLLALTVSTVCFGVYTLDKMSAQSVSDQFWNPLLKSPGSVLTVIPTVLHAEGRDSRADSVAFIDSSHGPYSRISVCDAIALARFASLLGRRSKSFDVKEAKLTNLVDLHERPSILVGAVNNHWTMRLTDRFASTSWRRPLRYKSSTQKIRRTTTGKLTTPDRTPTPRTIMRSSLVTKMRQQAAIF
jgi:hypothetical protein